MADEGGGRAVIGMRDARRLRRQDGTRLCRRAGFRAHP